MTGRRSELVIGVALERAGAFVAGIPEAKPKRREVAAMVSAICAELVSARPCRDPTAAEVSDVGKVRHARFPAAQTMLNHYPELLRIWRSAYADLLRSDAVRKGGPAGAVGGDNGEPDLAEGADAGSASVVNWFRARLRAEQAEGNRLRKMIEDNIPVTAEGGRVVPGAAAPPAGEHVAIIRRFVATVKTGGTGLDEAPGGWIVSRRSRMGAVAVPREVVDAILLACGNVVGQTRE